LLLLLLKNKNNNNNNSEIRTPLHQVTGFIDLLHETELTTEQQSYVKLLRSSAQGLMTVISGTYTRTHA
jgi:signal transduction histidine kinase